MQIERGFRTPLDTKFQLDSPLSVKLNFQGSDTYDICCFGVDQYDKLSDDRYMIFYNQLSSPERAISLQNQPNNAAFSIQLSKLPNSIHKLVFTVNIDGSGTMSQLQNGLVEIAQQQKEKLELILNGNHFDKEKAIIAIEIYRKGEWRINAVARGFNGGLPDLLSFYGGKEAVPETQTTKPPQAPPTPPPATKVELRKGQKVNLHKEAGTSFNEITVNLNWNAKPQNQVNNKGFFANIFNKNSSDSIDLDLACLYECKNGNKGCIQALGNNFGSFNTPPYIMLDQDDRTGSSTGGETMRINGNHLDYFNRILIFTFIYEGIANWRQVDGVVTLKCPGNPDLIVKMDEHNASHNLCAIAMLENIAGQKISVEKIINFYPGHSHLDKAFGWGMQWKAGRK